MADVYSVRFVAIQGLDGTLEVTVPDGLVYILRDLDVYNGGGLTVTTIYLTGAIDQTIYFAASEAGPLLGQWRGRQVMEPGDTFKLTTTGLWDATLSGYSLTAP